MESVSYFRAILALIFVLSVIAIISFLLKRFSFNNKFSGLKSIDKRISIEEIHALDTKRRLVLVKRDDVEHLLLLGATSDVVVESNIKANFKNQAKEVDISDHSNEGE